MPNIQLTLLATRISNLVVFSSKAYSPPTGDQKCIAHIEAFPAAPVAFVAAAVFSGILKHQWSQAQEE